MQSEKIKKINLLLETLLIILGLLLIFNIENITILLFFGAIKLTRFLDKKYSWNFSEYYYSFFLISIYLSILGDNFFRFYYVYPNYDKFLHFFIPIGLGYILATIVKPNFFSILISTGLVSLMEIIEFLVDLFYKTTTQGVYIRNQGTLFMDPLTDTMFDMLIGFLASLIGYIIYRLRIIP